VILFIMLLFKTSLCPLLYWL